MREICLDTETTGMAAKEGDRIIEIGCVELGEHGLTDKNFHEYIDPERQMEAEVIRVHKITNEFLVGKPKFADIADKFIEFVQGARLIIHNAQFDIGFLNEELRKLSKSCSLASFASSASCSSLRLTLKVSSSKS